MGIGWQREELYQRALFRCLFFMTDAASPTATPLQTPASSSASHCPRKSCSGAHVGATSRGSRAASRRTRPMTTQSAAYGHSSPVSA